MEPAPVRRQRLPASERRRQIIDAVFQVVSAHGIPGATIARVAERAGVGIGTVYRYFDDQKAMLRSAVETLSVELIGTIPGSFSENALDHIRHQAKRHQALVSLKGGYLAGLWLEFVSANEQVGLRETVLKTQLQAMEAIREVCERGKVQGSIRADVDVDLLAYRILEQAWGVDMSVLMGLNNRFGRDFSAGVLEELIASISARP